jgi:hypothetical protein
MQNKAGRIVSKAKHMSAKKDKRLVKAGFLTKKGHFGFIKNGKSMRKGRSRSRSRKMRGGMALGGNLSPMAYEGHGEGLRGDTVGVQMVAGNAA